MRSNRDPEKREGVQAPLPDDPPTQAELDEAERLRRSLEASRGDHGLADFAAGIRAMAGKGPGSSPLASESKHLEVRIAEGMKRGAERNRFRRVRNIGAIATGLSLAAAAMLWMQNSGAPTPSTSAVSLPQSTVSLLPSRESLNPTDRSAPAVVRGEPRRSRSAAEYFLTEGSTRTSANFAENSGGLDRLIAARLDDYRENRFRAWGVR